MIEIYVYLKKLWARPLNINEKDIGRPNQNQRCWRYIDYDIDFYEVNLNREIKIIYTTENA